MKMFSRSVYIQPGGLDEWYLFWEFSSEGINANNM